MTVRKILSAKTARPQVEEMLQALVEAAVYMGRANGRFNEDELEVFIDTMREVVSSALGEEFIEQYASTPVLLDAARKSRGQLEKDGPDTFLGKLAPKFKGQFGRDGLVLAWRIVLADGRVEESEAQAFEKLAKALGIDVDETAVLKDLAGKSEAASKAGHVGASLEILGRLEAKGWARVPGGTGAGFDLGMALAQPSGGRLVLELDASESVLHVHVLGNDGDGPHLMCLFGSALEGLLAVLDALRTTLMPSTIGQKLPAIAAVCPEVFVENQGKFAKV